MKQIGKYIGLYIILGIVPIILMAQSATSLIVGKVMDESKMPLPYASVSIYRSGKPLNGVITDDNGRFSIKTQQSENPCKLMVDFVGYVKMEIEVVPNQPKVDMGSILLKENAIALGEVTVTGKETARKSTVEHTVINASANMASDKGSALDILRTSSAVTLQEDGISIRGNSNILVLIDGVPTTVSDLSVLPAANIKSVEVITNPDASYDAEGTGGIINIVSKKMNVQGKSGVISANYGFNHFVTGNVAFAYNRPKASWRFSYNTKFEDDAVNSSLNRKVKESGKITDQQMNSDRRVFNNNIGVGADFKWNNKNRLAVDLKFMTPRLNIGQELVNRFENGTTTSREQRKNDVTWNRENVEASITFNRIVKPEVSDFSIKGSLSKIWGHRPSYYYREDKAVSRSNSGGSPFIPTMQIDYKHKTKMGTWTSGAKLTYRRNDIYHEFYSKEGNDWNYSSEFSNDLLHTELIPAAYLLFSSKPGKKWSYKAGVRSEFSSVTLDSKHENLNENKHSFFLAPSFSATYKLSKKQEMSVAFSRRIGRPTYPQLNPYMSMVDASTYEQGNMHLLPEKSSKLDVSYQLRSEKVMWFVNAYANYTTDYISQVTQIENDLLITTYINAESDWKAGTDMSLKYIPNQWINATLSTNTYYTKSEGGHGNIGIDNQGWTNNSNLLVDWMPRKGTSFQWQYFVTTPQYFPQLTTSFTHQMNMGVKQKFMKGALTLSLLLTDVLDTYRWKVSSHNQMFDLTNVSTNKSRMLWVGLSYNFNSFKQKNDKKTETDRSLIKFGAI